MKRNILYGILFAFLSIQTFSMLFAQESSMQNSRIRNPGQSNTGHKIVISSGNSATEDIYFKLRKYSDKYKANISCTIIEEKNDKTIYRRYIYFTRIQAFYDISLKSGRLFNLNESESDKFLSTENLRSSMQIGEINSFAQQQYFEIHTLKSGLNTNIFNRVFYLDLEDANETDNFINDLKNENIFIIELNEISAAKSDQMLFNIIVLTCFFILMLIVFYDILNSYKNIAIEKMLGFSKAEIWYARIAKICLVEFIAMIVCNCILFFMNFKVINALSGRFITELLIKDLVLLIFTAGFLSLPFIYINKINIPNMIKNKRPTDMIIKLNFVVKVLLISFFILLAYNSYNQYRLIASAYSSSFSKWEETRNYAVIPSSGTIGNGSDYYSLENEMKEKEIYFYFNKRGAVFANFQIYSPLQRKYNKANIISDFVTINPNYLSSNPIFDLNNKKIIIDETEQDYILLIPEKYKQYEKAIEQYHYKSMSSGSGDENGGKSSIASNRKIRSIIYRSNQKMFSYQLDINPNESNCVTDPVISILTENNGDIHDYFYIIGYMGNPFKIKVKDAQNPSAEIIPVMQRYFDMNQSNIPVVSLYDSVQDQIVDIKSQIYFSLKLLIILGLIILLIIVQSVYNYFEQNKFRIAIQKFLGYKRLIKYTSYFAANLIACLIVSLISNIILKKLEILYMLGAFCLAEFLATALIILIIEKREIVKVIKGGG